jgi:hypothetical protein
VPHVAGCQRRRVEETGEPLAPDECERHEPDPVLYRGWDDLVLDVAADDAPFGLDRGDGMNRGRPANLLTGRLQEAEVEHLALRDQLRHRTDGLLDRDRGIHLVLVVEVDAVGSQELQTVLDLPADLGPVAADAAAVGTRPPHDAELDRELDLVRRVDSSRARIVSLRPSP